MQSNSKRKQRWGERKWGMDLVDREPNFYRSRLTRCAACGHEQSFCDHWFKRWSYAEEVSPGCGVNWPFTDEHG